MAVLTVMVVWSECVFFIKTPVLSLFAIFLNVATTHVYNYIAIEVRHSGTVNDIDSDIKSYVPFIWLASALNNRWGGAYVFRFAVRLSIHALSVHQRQFHFVEGIN